MIEYALNMIMIDHHPHDEYGDEKHHDDNDDRDDKKQQQKNMTINITMLPIVTIAAVAT